MSTINLLRVGVPATSRASIPGNRSSTMTSKDHELTLHNESGLVRIKSKRSGEVCAVHVSRFEYIVPEEPVPALSKPSGLDGPAVKK